MKSETDSQDTSTPFAYFGPSEQHSVPEGGFCISVFAILRREGKVLLVKPRENVIWQQWAPNWKGYEPERLSAEMVRWRLPATYVREGEAPKDGLRRVMEDQLGVKRYSSAEPRLLNFYEPSRRFPGRMHWDYCFVFDVSTDQDVKQQEWLTDVAFMDPSGVKSELGSAHSEIFESIFPR